jgi:hypothetical protein
MEHPGAKMKDDGFVMADLEACNYCKYMGSYGTHAAVDYCNYWQSPFNLGMDGFNEVDRIKGCRKFDYNPQNGKLRMRWMRYIPNDSAIRTLNPRTIITDFVPGTDISSALTSQELAHRFESLEARFEDYLVKHPKIIVKNGSLVPYEEK